MKEQDLRSALFKSRMIAEQNSMTISERFPSIEKISINLSFTYIGVIQFRKERAMVFRPHDKAFFQIDCINSDCVKTDLNLDDDVQSMVRHKKTKLQGLKCCNGYQTYERYLNRGNHCLTEMEFEIKIEYI